MEDSANSGHLRYQLKPGKKRQNLGESSNMRFTGFDDFHFPSQGTPAYQQNGSENGRSYNVAQNKNYSTNPNPSSGIRSGTSRYMDSA
jgi:hypothetical protein